MPGYLGRFGDEVFVAHRRCRMGLDQFDLRAMASGCGQAPVAR
jgi:hypothetical protein